MIKWLILALAAYVLYRLFANDILKKRQKEEKVDKKEMEKKVASGEMVKDPVCGAYVSLDDSITVRDGERRYHFCSYECRDKFIKSLTDGSRVIEEAPAEEKKD
ncbi:MAG: YHS domain-containing protein [Candidatus Desulfovibrio faecigallinarum]|uniref:YHS domain-containing protein n=1 Tax=Desulfovibrio sp. An276 TaxID=1965618 RepID=UPI000B375E6F|nr:YHS domain-containing protein [Desulfovibrio sp. An276]MBU3832720.1 YHS domain-containing protein [Candidatus Desulfovibrio faecigallinarum]OUO53613.1 transcriptional regulator [Desulfovibrio sp. An276]